MNSDSRAQSAARRRFVLRWEGLEGRALLSVAHAPAAVHVLASAAPAGEPTAHELARETFVAKTSNSYVVGPGRFTDQARSISFVGSGGSSMASHTNLQMIVFTPTDTVNGTITGQAAFSGRDIGSTGTQLALDLTGDPTSEVNGLPTHFTWQVNGSSGGIFSGATGQGTLDVHYVPGGKVPRRGISAGRAYITVQGLVNVVGIYDDLAAPGNRP